MHCPRTTAGTRAFAFPSRRHVTCGCVVAAAVALTACGKRAPELAPDAMPAKVEPTAPGAAADGATAMTLTAEDFTEGRPIPRVHAYVGEGENQPPALGWKNLPPGTRELALIVEDPDAPTPEPWIHDILYKIPPDATPMTMILRGTTVDSAARFFEGVNSWGETRYGGPFPPPGQRHRYFFSLYALDSELDVQPNLTKPQLLAAMEGHILGRAVLMGTYQR